MEKYKNATQLYFELCGIVSQQLYNEIPKVQEEKLYEKCVLNANQSRGFRVEQH